MAKPNMDRPPNEEWAETTDTTDSPTEVEAWAAAEETVPAGGLSAEKSGQIVPQGPLPIGTVLGGSYRLERVIGVGGMGVVYEASHTRLRLRYAVKLLYAQYSSNRESVARFRREAQICSELGHANIVKVVDFNTLEDGTPYIVMELLRGEDLGERLRRVGKASIDWAAGIFAQAADALHAAHRSGIVHRDLKPQNIFLSVQETSTGDVVKIVDFGISKIIGHGTALTQASAICGSPWYMPPEQAKGQPDQIDARTDVFAMGAILYEMLGGQPPFGTDGSIPAILYRVVHEAPVYLHKINPSVPPIVSAVVQKALEKKRSRRFQSMGEFDRMLRAAIQGTLTPEALAASSPDSDEDESSGPIKAIPSATGPGLRYDSQHIRLGAPSLDTMSPVSIRRVLPWALLGAALLGLLVVLLLPGGRAPHPSGTAAVAPLGAQEYFARAKALASEGRHDEALQALEKMQLATADPDMLGLASRLERSVRTKQLLQRAQAAADANDRAKAIEALDDLQMLAPDNAEAKALRAKLVQK